MKDHVLFHAEVKQQKYIEKSFSQEPLDQFQPNLTQHPLCEGNSSFFLFGFFFTNIGPYSTLKNEMIMLFINTALHKCVFGWNCFQVSDVDLNLLLIFYFVCVCNTSSSVKIYVMIGKRPTVNFQHWK